MQQGIPGSPPPASYAPGNNALGPQAGTQAKEQWSIGQTDERQLLSAMRAPHLWRVTLHGENVLFRVSWGTSSNIVVANVQAPARFVVPGSCDVYAVPVQFDEDPHPAHAEVTCTPATSGTDAIMRSRIFAGPAALDVNAARFVALTASVVGVGPGLAQQNVNLNPNESVPLTAGSHLVSGTGFLEYEP